MNSRWPAEDQRTTTFSSCRGPLLMLIRISLYLNDDHEQRVTQYSVAGVAREAHRRRLDQLKYLWSGHQSVGQQRHERCCQYAKQSLFILSTLPANR